MGLFDKLIKTLAEHHCEETNQQMVNKTIKIGTERHLPSVRKAPSFISGLCKVAAEVYCDAHNLELTSNVIEK